MSFPVVDTAVSGAGVTVPWQRLMSLANRCSNMRQLKAIHAIFTTYGLHLNNYALSKLLSFAALSPSGSLSYASLLFSHSPQPLNSFFYNTLIRAHSRGPHPRLSLSFFHLILSHPTLAPDHLSYAFALAACANIPSLSDGRNLHGRVLKNGLVVCDIFVQKSLLQMYADCGLIAQAHQLFDEIPTKVAVVWNVVINGYLRSGHASKALGLFRDMLASDVAPDRFCIATGIAASAHSGALMQGVWIHDYARRKGFAADDIFIGTSLVDMYAKCGCLDKAVEAFEAMPERNVFSWSAIIGAFAMHGFAKEALSCLDRMEKEDQKQPDWVVLLGILTACSHGGLREEGYRILYSMERRYNIPPRHEHYSCMVDLLCRAGQLQEAFELIRAMPMKPRASIWGALLSGATIYRNVELAELAANNLLKIEKDSGCNEDGVYVQLSNVYFGASRHEDARRVRMMMRSKGVKKTPGCSVIEVDGKMHEFVSGDPKHPQGVQIQAMLNILYRRMM